MEQFEYIIKSVSGFLWSWPMLVLLFGTHIYLTIKLRFPQRKLATAIKLSVASDKKSKGEVSPFAALTTALAATIGTANIVGVATAVSLGGPGAVFWCWLTGILGFATKYSECLLSIKYRTVSPAGVVVGGPMYVLKNVLKMRWLAILFCVFTVVASFGIGNMVQSNAIALLVNESWTIPYEISGAVTAILVMLVIIFGLKGIARVCSTFVPLMAAIYIIGCLLVFIINIEYIPDTIVLIAKCAFNPEAAGGGFVGAAITIAARYGIARGLFSNESGMGSEPIIAASAQTRNPARQALVSASGTFWDTVVICALTGIVVVSAIIANPEISYNEGGRLTALAFSKIPILGEHILSISLFTFAFSTLLGWSYYGEKSIEFLCDKKHAVTTYRICWVVAVYIGAIANLSIVWGIAEIMNAFMALPNLIALLLLSGVVAKETKYYVWGNRLDDYDPTSSAKQNQ